MALTVSAKGGGKDFAPHPTGVYAARCVRIIDLGTQTTTWKGQQKNAHKIIVGFETEALIEDGEKAGKPFLVQSRYTASLGEKGLLRRDLESWRGRRFTDQELGAFDLKNVLNKACLLNIVHADSGGKTYANVTSVMPLPPSMKAPPQSNQSVLFSLSDFDAEVFDSLSDGLKETIAKSPEFKALSQKSRPPPPQQSIEEMEDDIPF